MHQSVVVGGNDLVERLTQASENLSSEAAVRAADYVEQLGIISAEVARAITSRGEAINTALSETGARSVDAIVNRGAAGQRPC